MRSATALVREVKAAADGNVTMYLSTADKHCPLYLIVTRPPPSFESVVGTTLEITREAVYVGGKLWGKRTRDDRQYVVLETRGK